MVIGDTNWKNFKIKANGIDAKLLSSWENKINREKISDCPTRPWFKNCCSIPSQTDDQIQSIHHWSMIQQTLSSDKHCRSQQFQLTRTSRRVSRFASLANSLGVFFGANGLYAFNDSILYFRSDLSLSCVVYSSLFPLVDTKKMSCDLIWRLLVLVVNN